MPKIQIEVSKAVVVTSNHGGYLGGECLACGAVGWLDGGVGYAHDVVDPDNNTCNRLKHKKTCPVDPHALKVFKRD